MMNGGFGITYVLPGRPRITVNGLIYGRFMECDLDSYMVTVGSFVLVQYPE